MAVMISVFKTVWLVHSIGIFCVLGASTDQRLPNASIPCAPKVQPTEWIKTDFPNPQTDIDKCGQECQKSWICDPNGVLTDSYLKLKIQDTLVRIRRNGRCGCSQCNGKGYKISVALINKLKFENWEVVSSEKKTEKAIEFASYLRSTAWHPTGTCKDDVVIFVSRGDRKVQTAVGPQANDILSPHCISKIYSSVKSDLSQGYFDKAINRMVNRYEQAIVNGHCDSSPNSELGLSAIIGIIIGGVAFVAIVVVLAVCLRCTGGSGVSWRYHPGSRSTKSGEGDSYKFSKTGDGGGAGGGDF